MPPGSCYFRKSFTAGPVESAEVQISCDNAYELYVNGRQVGDGDNWRTMKSHDITKFLVPGRNTVAIKAINKKQGSAGLVARVIVKETGGTYVAYNTDATWRTSLQEFPQWTKTSFNDSAMAGGARDRPVRQNRPVARRRATRRRRSGRAL